MSVYNSQSSNSFLQEIEIMSTDIRALQQIAADNLAASQTAQATANTAQATASINTDSIQSALDTIAINAGAMVRKSNPVAIASNEFVLNASSGVYEYVLTHGLNDEFPDVEILDSQREKQLIQSVGIDANSVKLELTAGDIAQNAWPLYAIVLARPGTVLPIAPVVSLFKRLGITNHWYQLVGTTLKYSPDGVTADTNMDNYNVLQAFMLTNNGQIYIKYNDNTYYMFAGALPAEPGIEITQVTYDSRVGFTDRIVI